MQSGSRGQMGTAVGFVLTLFVLVPDNASGRWFTLAAVVASVVLLGALFRARIHEVPNSIWLLVGFYFVVTLSTLAQYVPAEVGGMLQRAVPLVLLAITAAHTDMADQQRIAVWVVAVGIGEAGLSLLQQYFHVLPTWGWLADSGVYQTVPNEITGGIGRTPGTFSHGIPLGLFIGTAIIFTLSGRVIRRWSLRVGVSAFLVWGLVQTGSRSSVIVLAVTVALMGVVLIRNWFLKLFLIAAMTVAMFLVDFRGLSLISSLQGTASLTHRASAGETLSQLLDLGPWNALFGNGWAFTQRVTDSGVGSRTIQAIDNGFVSTIALAGLIGFACFVAMVIRGLRRADNTTRFAIIMTLGMYMSFDVELWAASLAPLIVFLFQARLETTKDPSVEHAYLRAQPRGRSVISSR